MVVGSELEEYRKKALVGHWILVKESNEDLRREYHHVNKAPKEFNRIGDDARFTVDNLTARPGLVERFMNVSRRGYVHADCERFVGDPFDRVSIVNADDNLLQLVTFRTFKSVRRLSLRRNNLESVEPIGGDLAETLISLDVSENRLKPDDIYSLSTSRLEQLYVSANRLTTVPESITDYRCFLALEILDLSDNLLSCPRTFYVLSTLHSLQVLNLSDNRISFIPYLVTRQPINIDCTNGKNQAYLQDEKNEKYVEYDNKDNENEFVYHVQHIPFVSLNTINLSNNSITENSSVLSLISWPSLTNVMLTANTISLTKNLTEFKKLKTTLSAYNIEIER